ncbi:hypothetical protein PGH26_03535 [Sporosarcina jeotgali]|uniref:Initiator Rep protein domain-containing protein n=1 Tax=Sporosarcina jeotgali TaxID=3020056 RepID=A0ABZ0KXW7_9BACL|nr:hypothetical protein [Sporosarcina sp. B2O-1]WOV85013.1 hypothetical protein PGH26_03535 [Sporosarcina sp. B2O-1]
MKTNEEKKDFIKEFSVINKNKFSLQQTKSLYLGLIYELILDKEVFQKNIELNYFISEVFDIEYSEYLFKARPYLASRLLKDLINKYEDLNISYSVKRISTYLDRMEFVQRKDTDPKNKSNKLEDDVIGWVSSISKNKEGR